MKRSVIIIIAMLISVLCSNMHYAIADSWTQKADFGGTGKSSAVGFSIGNKGYIGTGSSYDGSIYTYYKDFWEYDPATNTWTQKADFGGVARDSAVGFSIGSKGYIGTGADESLQNDFWEYDPSTNAWTKKADFGGPARWGAVGFSIGSKGYIGTGADDFGGSTRYKDFWEYDPSANTWTQRADFGGIARYYAIGFSIGNKGYIGTGGTDKNDFWEYDPTSNVWTRKADLTEVGRLKAVGFSIGSKGYIATGDPTTIEKEVWEYSPDNNTWTRKTDFGGAGRRYAVGFSIGNKGYVGTGYNWKDFWEYDPDTSAALKVQIPQTGQTTCWDANGNVISCAGTGQDGEKQAGVAWPNPRFTNNGDETITDNLTGLIWTKDANAPGPSACGPGAIKNWQGALDYVACLNTNRYLGYNDWHLPNRKELKSLVNYHQTHNGTWLNGQGFSNIQSNSYWSSSTEASSSHHAWTVYVSGGGATTMRTKSESFDVWPVRGGRSTGTVQLPKTGQTSSYAAGDDGAMQKGIAWPNPRFTNNGNGTVTDNLTGLTWLQNAKCAGDGMYWTDALTWSNNLASGACGLTDGSAAGDWRLPNIEELESLIDLQKNNLALPTGHPFNVKSNSYWSSSSHVNHNNYAWNVAATVDMLTGSTSYNDKPSSWLSVWPVRDGQSGQLSSLYAAFTNAGIWKYSNTGTDWTQTTTSNPQLLVTVGADLYGTFEGLGIWKLNGTDWTQTTTSVPQMIVGSSTTLYGTFAGLGIWQWNGSAWAQTTSSNPQKIVASTSDLYGTFAGLGIWKWNGTAWTQLTTSVPDLLVTSGTKLYGTFAGLGIWLWNGTQWVQATPNTPQMIAANSTTLYGTFEGQGIWSWDGASTWTKISTDTPTKMVASGTELYASFTGTGIRKWDGTAWTLISGNEPVRMVVGQ